jgi:hypothetical protein
VVKFTSADDDFGYKFVTLRSNKCRPKCLHVRASRVREQRRFSPKNLLDKRLCFLEKSLILDKNVVACLRVRDHKLYVLFQSLTLSMGLRDFINQTYPQKSIDACYGSVGPG